MDERLEAAIPAKGYIHDYVEFGSRVTMAPPEFHLAAALCQMSAIMGNRVKFPLGGRTFPTHLWIVLLGKAGAARKSTAVSLATSMLDEAAPGLRLPQETTREALWTILANSPRGPVGFIELSEFMSFLQRSKKEYMLGITEDLCEMFDCPPHMERALKRRDGTERYTVSYPSLTVLGAGVTDVIGQWVRQKDLSGGFLSRFLLVPQSTEVEYRGMVNHFKDPMRESLLVHLRELARHQKLASYKPPFVVQFDGEALAAWEAYDKRLFESREIRTSELSGFFARGGMYAAKLALCYSFSFGEFEPTEADVAHAAAFVDYARESSVDIMDLFGVDTYAGRDIQRIAAAITRIADDDGWANSREVLRRVHLKSREFEDLLETMHKSDMVTMEMRGSSAGRPVRGLRLLKKGIR